MVHFYFNQDIPKQVRRGPKIERWGDGFLIGFRRHFMIWVPR